MNASEVSFACHIKSQRERVAEAIHVSNVVTAGADIDADPTLLPSHSALTSGFARLLPKAL
eukprot:3978548-Karenia_brevis.AAC.1